MNKNLIEKRAQRIMSKVNALGFIKNGSPMVIDQAREIVAAEEGFRNWHALRSSVAEAPVVEPSEAATVQTQQSDAEDTCNDGLEAPSQGWWLFEASTGDLQIQRDDEADVFDSDDEAWAFVIRKAHEDPSSAAAQAITRIYLESPEEYRRLASFDADAGRLLPTRSSAGHPVDLAEVAEWVGRQHNVNFETTSGTARQGWIDRFAISRADAGDERFAFYLVCEDWSHMFWNLREERTRWVLKLGGPGEGIVFAEMYNQACGWQPLLKRAKHDLQESVYDNDIPNSWQTAWSSEVKPSLCLPSWAKVHVAC